MNHEATPPARVVVPPTPYEITFAAYGISPFLCNLLNLLMSMPFVTSDVIHERLSVSNPKMAIFRLRKALAPHELEIKSGRFAGYWLDDEMKARVRSMLDEHKLRLTA